MKTRPRPGKHLLDELTLIHQQTVRLAGMKARQARTEASLSESQARHDLITETATEGIYHIDEAGQFLFVNQVCATMLGYQKEDLLGTHCSAIVPAARRAEAARIAADVMSGKPTKGDFTLQHKLGHEIPVHFSMGPLIQPGKPPGLSGTIQDITDRKRTEQALRETEHRYRTLADTINDYDYAVDAAGILTYVSPLATRLGIDPEKAAGKSFLDFIINADRKRVKREFERSVLAGKEFVTAFRIMDSSGEFHWLEDHGKMQRDEAGTITGITGVLRDVTDRRRTEEQLQKAREELETGIAERTRELGLANRRLAEEIAERRRVEEELREAEAR